MIFNGHTADSVDDIDEETFAEITVMWADGMLGTKAVFDALTPITTATFNFMRDKSTPAFIADKIFPWIMDYAKNPDLEPTEQDKINEALLTFLTAAPGFDMGRFRNVG